MPDKKTAFSLPLNELGSRPAGGKAEGLARLMAMGLAVPPGFAVFNASEDQLPDDLQQRYQAMGSPVVAVRSSAIGEDSADASFAGQYETLLNVQGTQALEHAIRQCVSSAHSLHASAYKDEKSGLTSTPMVVVVQQQVDALCAGVLFTADPVSNRRDHLVIDAVEGLGESLVSGEATPDHYLFQHDGLCLRQELVNSSPILSPTMCQELINGALAASKKMGYPLDMEWAFDKNGQLFWLQARPITTLGSSLNEIDTPLLDASHIYTRCNVSEALPGALCPLTHSVTGRGLEVAMQMIFCNIGILRQVDANWYVMANFYNHMFMNLSTMAWTPGKIFGTNADDLALAVCGRIIPELNEQVEKPPLLERIPYMLRYLRLVLQGGKYRKRMKRLLDSLDFSKRSTAMNQWQMIDEQMHALHQAHHAHLVSSMHSGTMTPTLLGILAKGEPPTDAHHAQVAALLAGTTGVESADIAEGATRIQQLLLQQDNLAQVFTDVPLQEALAYLESKASGEAGLAFRDYLERHGHRSISEMDMRMKEWACDPLPLVESLQSPLRALLKQQKAGKKTAALHSSHHDDAFYKSQNLIVRKLVDLTRNGVRGRETSKSLLVNIKAQFKAAYRELAELMVREKLIEDNDLLYFFTHEELGLYLQERDRCFTENARARRELFPQQQQLVFSDVFTGLPTPLPPETEAAQGEKSCSGKSVSRGKAIGPAKVARNITEASKLEPGDILIAPITDVAWTPYFSLIAGLATDIGSSVSHGAVVAREYGLPAIVKTDVGTRTFSDNDLVVLDADHGILRLATAEETAAYETA